MGYWKNESEIEKKAWCFKVLMGSIGSNKIQSYCLRNLFKTSRDRPKLAPYPRLKNSKRTSKCQFTVLENRKTKKMDRVARRGPLARAPGALKRGETSKIVNIFVAVEGGNLWRELLRTIFVSSCGLKKKQPL